MTVERVTADLNLEAGDRLIVLYGVDTSEHFCTPDLLLRDIEWVLHRYLKSQGYQRILFFNQHQKLYFLDKESRDLCLPRRASKNVPRSNEMKVTPGPLGRRKRLLQNRSKEVSFAPNASVAVPQAPSLMSDITAIPHFHTAMVETEQQSAIVFSNAEGLANFTNQQELFGRIVEWSRLPPSNRNRCIFIFHHQNRNRLEEFCQRNRFTYLENLLQNREQAGQSLNICRLGAPIADEIEHLINYFRLVKGKPVNWRKIQLLCQWIAAENRQLNYWYYCFLEAKEISLIEARKRKWLSTYVSTEPALERLQKMIGLEKVKEEVKQRAQKSQLEKLRQQQGLSTEPPRLHMVFKGNPGTGKTTVARLIGEIYRDLGLLQRGQLVEVEHKDLVAGYVGQTAMKTDSVIDRALDGVLFIDEAYSLNEGGNNDFGLEAINTLLKRMEDEKHHLVVIIAGYPDKMKDFIDSNPGLKRRFSTEILFEDYKPEELIEIFRQRISQVKVNITSELETALINLFTRLYEERDAQFGNAGLVENLFESMEKQRTKRLSQQNLDLLHEPFDVEDLPPLEREISQQGVKNEDNLKQQLQKLDGMIGLLDVKQRINDLVNTEIANQKLKELGYDSLGTSVETRHMLFTGNPGTGKTTVARIIGEIFKTLGVLRKGHFKKVEYSDLVAEYVGQSAPKTKKVLEEALDGVLFIDEAYSLAGSQYGLEAINTLVPIMENERHRLVVIFAGYSQQMEEFLNANPGMKSRIGDIIEFPNYSGRELLQIFKGLCSKDQIHCPDEVASKLNEIFNRMSHSNDKNFANGRDVRNIYDKMVRQFKNRIVYEDLNKETMLSFKISDIPNGVAE